MPFPDAVYNTSYGASVYTLPPVACAGAGDFMLTWARYKSQSMLVNWASAIC